MNVRRVSWLLLSMWCLAASLALGAKLTDAEKQQQKVVKKLDAFAKEYDAAKDLSRKGKEIEKDVAELDKELEALSALDAAAAAELKGRRDSLVAAAKQAVGGAEAGKAAAELDKKLERAEKDFDPEKKNLLNLDQKALERTLKELDGLLEKLPADAKPAYQTRRDALVSKVQSGVGEAKVAQMRKTVVAVDPVAPANGAEAIAPMKPTWCEGVLESAGKLDTLRPGIPSTVLEVVTVNDFSAGILFSCLDPDYDVRQQVVAAWRQKLSNSLGIPAALNERLLKLAGKLLAQSEAAKKQQQELCTTQVKPLDSGTIEARGNRSFERIALECGNQRSDENHVELRDVDVPGGLTSQLATGAVVWRVLTEPASGGNAHWALTQSSDVAVLNAALTFDDAQFLSQLDGLKLNELGQARALISYFGARARLKGYVSLYKTLTPKVSGLQKVVFDAPAAGVKTFLANADKDKALLETALSLEAQSGENLKGCARKLWPQVEAALAGQGQAKLSELKLHPLLAYSVALCARQDKEVPGLESIFTYYAERQPIVRGPLGAAYQAVFEAYNELSGGTATARGFQPGERSGSSEKLSLEPPERSPVSAAELPDGVGHDNPLDPERVQSGGVVKAVEKNGELAKIVFRTEKYIVPDLECVETGRIDRILPDGTILYRKSCKKVGEHEETATAQPVELPAWAVAGLAPGNLVTVMAMPINSGGAGHGWIVEAWESKARRKRTSLFGIAP